MAEGIAFSILGKIGEYLVAPIGRQFKYLFCYNTNIENLRDQAKNLEDMKDGVQLSVAAARNNLEVVAPQVHSWLTNVERMMSESDRICKEKTLVDKGCLNGWCANPKTRYLFSREASKKAQIIVELRSEGKQYSKFSYPAPPVGMAASSSSYCSKGFQSRMSIMKEIINALKNDTVAMIGICGMGGIGKTTMVEEIAKRAKSEKNIDEFAIAVVSQSKDVIKIQGQLADMLGLKLQEQESIFARGQRLHERLTNGNRILVILDDVWEALDMGEIGIPVGDERKGCKVALTSRNESVCSQMGTQKNFPIELLSEQEAWALFKEMAGNCVYADDVRYTAREVAKECGRLPLALVTVAKALSNKTKHAWDDALQQLKRSTVTSITGVQKIVYSRIELSYSYLESKQAKSLLLLCCLFEEDAEISIEMLVRYGVGLELFEDLDTLADTRNRVSSLVADLRSNYLLLGEGNNVFVKMHDVVRDVVLSIASDAHGYMVRHVMGLTEWPEKDKCAPHTAISLHSNKMQELPGGLDLPNLNLLRVACWQGNVKISEDFFEGMKQLKVFHFSFFRYGNSLPTSFGFLTNLRALFLEHCSSLTDLSLIGGLQKLEILSFFNSKVCLPSKIGELSNLKLLDLRCRLDVFHFLRGQPIPRIPSGVLSCLRKLEELYMGFYFVKNHDKDNSASIMELNLLSRLKRLEIGIPGSSSFLLKLKDFHFQNLIEFDISMSSGVPVSYYPKYQVGENSLSLCQVDRILILEHNINVLLRRTKKLALKSVRDLKNVVKDLDEQEGFVHLENLELRNCDELEYVMDAEICHGSLMESSFERHYSWRNPIQPPSLGNLRVLQLIRCNAIKCLFKKSVVKCLVQLQTLYIQLCNKMEGIVLEEGGEDDKESQDKIVLPKLNSLELHDLPKFRSFTHSEDDHATQSLFNQQVLFPNAKNLEVSFLKSIKVLIKGDEMQDGSLNNLQNLSVLSCRSLETYSIVRA
ncbi:hypothetical protein LguiB_013688 [Lonicera macranthoides]